MEGDSVSAFTNDDPFVTTRTDTEGNRWWFRYQGASSIRIRPAGSDDWTNQIVLQYYGMRPADVTPEWLQERASAWIEQHDADVAAGQI